MKFIEHHCNHPNIEFIKNNVEIMDTIVFDLVSNYVLKKLKSLNTAKVTGYDNITMIKMVADYLSSHVRLLVNRCTRDTFPDILKRAEVTPVFKKKDDPTIKSIDQ